MRARRLHFKVANCGPKTWIYTKWSEHVHAPITFVSRTVAETQYNTDKYLNPVVLTTATGMAAVNIRLNHMTTEFNMTKYRNIADSKHC